MDPNNGSDDIRTFKVYKDEVIENDFIPEKQNYQFIGWYNGNSLYDFNSLVTNDLNLVAFYQEIKVEVKHHITFKYLDN